jgi:hypothetical protein
MKLSGHTSLDTATDIPESLRASLRGLWIESVEEYVALLAAVGQQQAADEFGTDADTVARSFQRASSLVAPARLPTLTATQRGGMLGHRVDPDVLEAFQARGTDGARRAAARAKPATAAALPASVRLMPNLHPVRNQGERGTCVAFASVALREFLIGARERLSEQFLYWACKETDGSPDPGTYIHTAMTALRKRGVCRAETWPYQPSPIPANESQGPPPPAALDDALRFVMPNTRTVEPSLVGDYKEILAGSATVRGMPVVVATLVCNSWYMSPETHRTGKITMPLPGEKPVPVGHAWCIVGYVDDETVPGGGYFIVRNSWSPAWAADSPEAAGHAMMPYAYVERCAIEAFSGESAPAAPVAAATSGAEETFERTYVRVLSRETRDVEGKLLRPGTPVIANPRAPIEIMEDAGTARQRFVEGGHFWSADARIKDWFSQHPCPAASDPRVAASPLAGAFLGALDENLRAIKGNPFPENKLPWWFALLPWTPHVRGVQVVTDLAALEAFLSERLGQTLGVPSFVPLSRDELRPIAEQNRLRVYRLACPAATVLVVVAWIAPWRVGASGAWDPCPLTPGHLEALREVVARLPARDRGRPVFTYYTVGTPNALPDCVRPETAGDYWTVLSAPAGDDAWDVRMPPQFATKAALRNFLDALRPETRQQRISRIKRYVDGLIEGGFAGTISVDKIKEATGYRRTAIRDAMLEMQDSGHYRLRRERGILRIERAKEGDPIHITSRSFQRGFVRKHGLLLASAAVGVSACALRGMLKVDGATGFVVLVALVYAAGLLQNALNKRATEEE